MSPLVSILIPCYNAERWVKQCIESALAQTYPSKEVIVADDGSTDGTLEVLESFGDKIQVLQTGHAGANVARNKLVAASRGDWLQFLDADDYLLPEKIADQIQLVDQLNQAVDLVYSPLILRYEARDVEEAVHIEERADPALNFIRWEPFGTLCLLLRKEAVLDSGGWKEDQPCCQEHEIILRFILNGKRFALVNKPNSVYRHHSSETISKKDPLRVVHQRMALTDRLEQHLNTTGQMTRAHENALYVARMESARSAYRWNPELARQLRRKAVENGQHWASASPALPIPYQLALRTFGFERAERLAECVRRWRNPESAMERG